MSSALTPCEPVQVFMGGTRFPSEPVEYHLLSCFAQAAEKRDGAVLARLLWLWDGNYCFLYVLPGGPHTLQLWYLGSVPFGWV